MFKKIKQQLSCIGCTSSADAFREIYIERDANYGKRYNDSRNSERTRLNGLLDQPAQCNSYSPGEHRASTARTTLDNNNEIKTQSPGSFKTKHRKVPPRQSAYVEYGSKRGKPLREHHQNNSHSRDQHTADSLPLRNGEYEHDLNRQWDTSPVGQSGSWILRTRPGRRTRKEQGDQDKTPHRRLADTSWDSTTFSSSVQHSIKDKAGVDKEIGGVADRNEADAADDPPPRRRSISFVDSCPEVRAPLGRRRSLSVSDSDRCLSSISGDGVEGSLVSLVKHQWHSQVSLAGGQQNSGHPKGILKHRAKSCSHVDGKEEVGERRARGASVSFVDTKFNESQLFSSARYKKGHDASLEQQDARHKTSAKGKHRNAHPTLNGKPPLPQKFKSNHYGTSRASSKYDSLPIVHNKSPPLNAKKHHDVVPSSKDSTDSGTYNSSLSSDDIPNERYSHDRVFRSSDSSVSSHSNSPVIKCSNPGDVKARHSAGGEQAFGITPRTSKLRRSRKKPRPASTRIDRVDSDGLSDSHNSSSVTSVDNDPVCQRVPIPSSSNSSTPHSRGSGRQRSNGSGRIREERDRVESSSDYVSCSDHPDDGTASSSNCTPVVEGVGYWTDNQSNDEMDRTLCEDDFPDQSAPDDDGSAMEHDRTLSEHSPNLNAPRAKQRPATVHGSKDSSATCVSVCVEDPLPTGAAKRATSVENLRTGKKVTTFERVVIDAGQSDSDSVAESAGQLDESAAQAAFRAAGSGRDDRPSHKGTADLRTSRSFHHRGPLEKTRQPPLPVSSSMRTIRSKMLERELDSGKLPAPDFDNAGSLMKYGAEGDPKSALDHTDFNQILIKPENIRIGRLILKDDTNSFCMCAGSYEVPPQVSNKDRRHCIPVTVQVYRGIREKEDRINLLKNVMAVRQLRHRYVHRVYGMALEDSPYQRHGGEVMILHARTHYLVTLNKLLGWIRENGPELLTLHCAMTFAIQLCEGLNYLEKKGIVHNNLSSHTVRISHLCHINLGGIEQFPVSSTQAPIRWMAIETLNTGDIQTKSIVWTFGVLLWEILSLGATPYSSLKTGLILYKLKKGHRLPCPAKAPTHINEMLLSCWMTKPQDRPSLAMLHEKLSLHQQTLPPSKPPAELFPDKEHFWNIVQEHT